MTIPEQGIRNLISMVGPSLALKNQQKPCVCICGTAAFSLLQPFLLVRELIFCVFFFKGTVAWDGFFGLFIPFLLDRMYQEVFRIWPVIFQGRARYCSFGVVGECDKHASSPSPTAAQCIFSYKLDQKKDSNVFFNGNYVMFIKNFFKDCTFSFTGSLQSSIFLLLLHSLSVVGECVKRR